VIPSLRVFEFSGTLAAGISDLAVHLDVPFAGKGERIPQFGRTGVVE